LTQSVVVGRNCGRGYPLDKYFKNENLAAPANLFDVIPFDQQQRWTNEERRPLEDYLHRFPGLRNDPQQLLDLVYYEYILQESLAPPPSFDAFAARFPSLAPALKEQIDFHLALEQGGENQFPENWIAEPRETGMPEELPNRIGRYQLLSRLGSGGMAEVYLARDSELDREVAIKVPRGVDQANQADRTRFLREAKALAALRHPNICPIYDFGEHREHYFIVMPVLEGQTLSRLLEERGRLPVDEAIELVTTVARAMQVAHQRGLVHRDLKPSNIMLDEHGHPVVMDFGLVHREIADDPRLTNTGVVAGTPAYLAPERLTSDDSSSSTAADIYSLGAVFYETITGRLPYSGKNAAQLLSRALTGDAETPGTWTGGIPRHVEEACMKAIAKSPQHRFGTMAEFAAALSGTKSSDDGMARRWKGRRSRLFFAVGSGLALVVIVLTSLFLRSFGGQVGTLQVGDVWTGSYYFLPDGPEGDVELTVEEMDEFRFFGKYKTENSEFVWAIEGTVIQGKLDFELTKALSSAAESVGAAGVAVVSGTLSHNRFQGEYQDSDSEAEITLNRRLN
jgi:predicted Ser/Thr protein kinase